MEWVEWVAAVWAVWVEAVWGAWAACSRVPVTRILKLACPDKVINGVIPAAKCRAFSPGISLRPKSADGSYQCDFIFGRLWLAQRWFATAPPRGIPRDSSKVPHENHKSGIHRH